MAQVVSKVLDLAEVSHSGQAVDNPSDLAEANHLVRVAVNRLVRAVDAHSGQAVEPASGQAEDNQ